MNNNTGSLKISITHRSLITYSNLLRSNFQFTYMSRYYVTILSFFDTLSFVLKNHCQNTMKDVSLSIVLRKATNFER